MACSCHRVKESEITDASDSADIYGSAYEDERNSFYAPNSDYEREDTEEVFATDENNYREMMFVDGNDEDLKVCEFEDTLMERVWRASKPPKIPKQNCVVPARRIQITKERLSPTLTPLSTLRRSPSDEARANESTTRRRVKSDVRYDDVHNLDDEQKFSCQKKTITVIPNCAKELREFL